MGGKTCRPLQPPFTDHHHHRSTKLRLHRHEQISSGMLNPFGLRLGRHDDEGKGRMATTLLRPHTIPARPDFHRHRWPEHQQRRILHEPRFGSHNTTQANPAIPKFAHSGRMGGNANRLRGVPCRKITISARHEVFGGAQIPTVLSLLVRCPPALSSALPPTTSCVSRLSPWLVEVISADARTVGFSIWDLGWCYSLERHKHRPSHLLLRHRWYELIPVDYVATVATP